MSKKYLTVTQAMNKIGASGSGSNFITKSQLVDLGGSYFESDPIQSYNNQDFIIDDDIIAAPQTRYITLSNYMSPVRVSSTSNCTIGLVDYKNKAIALLVTYRLQDAPQYDTVNQLSNVYYDSGEASTASAINLTCQIPADAIVTSISLLVGFDCTSFLMDSNNQPVNATDTNIRAHISDYQSYTTSWSVVNAVYTLVTHLGSRYNKGIVITLYRNPDASALEPVNIFYNFNPNSGNFNFDTYSSNYIELEET